MFVASSRLLLLACCSGLFVGMVSCSGGGSSDASIQRALPAVNATAAPAPSAQPVDDWTTFAHDQKRTGYQAQATGLSTTSVKNLTKRWSVALGEPIKASPLVSGGFVYVFGSLGTVRALAATTGATVWTTKIGLDVQMTPMLADGKIFIGTHSTPSGFYALDAKTGAILWTDVVPGGIRSEPVIVDGVVYEGDASGDEPLCNQGAIRGFDELTGATTMTWYDDPAPNDGGGIWGPLSTDGTSLYFGTGNTCSPNVSNANAAVKLSLSGSVAWAHNEADPLSDDDFGTALLLNAGTAYGSDKDGMFFAFDTLTGSIQWSKQLGVLDGFGAVGTATTDGSIIVTDGGAINDPYSDVANPGGLIYGLTTSGAILWKDVTNLEVRGSIAMNGGIAFVSMNDGIFALNAKTGAKLWTYNFGNDTYASPAVVPSGVYDCDDAGNVYAFSLPAAAQ